MRCSEKDSFLRDISAVVFSAFLIRLAYGIYTGSLFFPEVWEYEDIAVNLYQGRGFLINFLGKDYYGYSTPLYPLFCAVIYKLLGHNQSVVVLAQIFISSLLCAVIYLISLDIVDRSTALLSSFLVVFHPALIVFSSTKLHAFTLDAFLISLTLFSFLFLLKKASILRALACGVVYGLCALTRSTIIPFLPLAMLWFFWARKIRTREILKYFFVFISSAGIIIGIWSFRNFLVFKRFIPVTTVSTEVFWRGNNINASGDSFAAFGQPVLTYDQGFFNRIKDRDEIQRYDLFRWTAWDFIRAYPLKFLSLTLKKFYFFWWFSPHAGQFYPGIPFIIYKFGYFFILLFSIIGFISGSREAFRKTVLVFILLLVISMAQSLFYIEGRHRLAVEPLLLIFVPAGFIYIKERARKCLRAKI